MHEGVELEDILSQTPEDEKRTVIGPIRPRFDWVFGVSPDVGAVRPSVGVLTDVAEDELTRPQQLLSGLALCALAIIINFLWILARREHIVGIIGGAAPNAGL